MTNWRLSSGEMPSGPSPDDGAGLLPVGALLPRLARRSLLTLRADLGWGDDGPPDDGDNINFWFDEDRGIFALQTGSLLKPTYTASGQGGRPCISFDGNQYLTITDQIIAATGPLTVIAVTSCPEDPDQRIFSNLCLSYGFGHDDSVPPLHIVYHAGIGINTAGPQVFDTVETEIYIRDTSSIVSPAHLYVSGVEEPLLLPTMAASDPSAGVFIGAQVGAGSKWMGDVYLFMVLGFKLNAAQVAQVHRELNNFYSL